MFTGPDCVCNFSDNEGVFLEASLKWVDETFDSLESDGIILKDWIELVFQSFGIPLKKGENT